MAGTLKTIGVYCGSSDQVNHEYLEAASQMGNTIARRGLTIVYGAGKTGLMGAVADGALAAGGQVIGVLPRLFDKPELAHYGLTRLEIVETMHQRAVRLFEMVDAFIALPGGYGTFGEIFETLTWAQIGLHTKPVGLLNSQHYFDPLLRMIEHAHQEGMIYAEHQALFVQAEHPEELLKALENHLPPEGLERWLSRNAP